MKNCRLEGAWFHIYMLGLTPMIERYDSCTDEIINHAMSFLSVSLGDKLGVNKMTSEVAREIEETLPVSLHQVWREQWRKRLR